MNLKINLEKTETGLNRTHDVTVEELRAAGRFKKHSDQQLLRLIETVKTLTEIFLGFVKGQHKD